MPAAAIPVNKISQEGLEGILFKFGTETPLGLKDELFKCGG